MHLEGEQRRRQIFTATCFSNVAVMGSLDVRPSVCPSVCDVDGC